jgi:hypothetical protein
VPFRTVPLLGQWTDEIIPAMVLHDSRQTSVNCALDDWIASSSRERVSANDHRRKIGMDRPSRGSHAVRSSSYNLKTLPKSVEAVCVRSHEIRRED